MDNQLWQIRVKAFAVQAGVGLSIVILGFLGSDSFAELVKQNWGTGFVTSSIMLFLTGLTSHILNKIALGRAKRLGARIGDPDIILI